MSRPAFRIAAALLILTVAAARAAGNARAAETAALRKLVQAGETAPGFALQDINGRTVSVKPGDGKPSLIVFFSVFCPLCRELAPSVREIASRSDGRVRVVGVNLDGRRFAGAVRSFIAEYGFGFPVLLDEIRNDLFLASDSYGVDKTPTAVLIDGRGAVRASYAGDRMRELVRDFDRIAAGLERD